MRDARHTGPTGHLWNASGAARHTTPVWQPAARGTRWRGRPSRLRTFAQIVAFCLIWAGLLIWPAPQLASFAGVHGYQLLTSLGGKAVSNFFTPAGDTHQYWQVGLQATLSDAHTTGMRATIQTRVPQRPSADTTNYYWTGSYLSDGSFVQVGYYVAWYDTNHAGWFYCAYDTHNQQGPCKYGTPGSAGADGSLHSYELESTTKVGHVIWTALVDGVPTGSFGWTTGESGMNTPALYAESSGFSAHPASSQLGPVSFPTGLDLRLSGQSSYQHAARLIPVYSAPNVCPPYGIKSDGQGGALLGSGLPCPSPLAPLS